MTMGLLEHVDERLASDGCDRCGHTVRATHLALLGQFALTFCNHHANEYGPALLVKGFDISLLTQ